MHILTYVSVVTLTNGVFLILWIAPAANIALAVLEVWSLDQGISRTREFSRNATFSDPIADLLIQKL